MNRYAIRHKADSSYCFPISKTQIVLRLQVGKNDIKEAYVIYECKYVIHERQKKEALNKCGQSELFDYYSVELLLEDTRLAYIFQVFDGERWYLISEDGVTDNYDFSKGFYNFFQYAYINEIDVMKPVEWMKKAVFYQIFVERFQMGDNKKDKSYINAKWGEIPKPETFTGGDLKGIIGELDYLKSLGINTLYLTPIFKSISNHKYDISDYYEVDPQFGTNEDLKELIARAHSMEIKIVLDAVFNHCSENLMQFRDVVERGKESPYFDWFIIYGDRPDKEKQNYEMFGFCGYMPKFNTSNPKVQEFLIDIAVHYIRDYHIDGWRLDVSDEVSHDFWRNFRKAVKNVNKDTVIIGENWVNANSYLLGDQYDSIMNYAFTKACLDYFAWGTSTAEQFAWKLNELLNRNSDTVNDMMLNLLDSHDTYRFFSEIGKDKKKMMSALCTLFMFPGTPCIYYGTEQLIEGGYDPDGRRCMNWELGKKYSDIKLLIQKLSELRTKYNIADSKTDISCCGNVFTIRKETKDSIYWLYINNTDLDEIVNGVVVPANSYGIYQNGKQII